MLIVCHASASIMSLGAIVRGETEDLWSIIDHQSYETMKDADCEEVTLDLNALRRSVGANTRVHLHRFEDGENYDLIFSPFTCDREPSILCVSLKREGRKLVYQGDTCVSTDDPFGFCGSALNAQEESEIESIVLAAIKVAT